jgi:hypothetical protein
MTEVEQTIELGRIKFKQLTDKMDIAFTFLGELCTPINRVVVPHTEITLYHLATKHNKTGIEVRADIGINKPKVYKLNSIDECVEAAKELSFNDEGYVVVDKDCNRVKIKSKEYLRMHRIKGDSFSIQRFFEMIQTNESSEFIIHFPEYIEITNKAKNIFNTCNDYLNKKLIILQKKTFKNRKEYAFFIKDWFFKDFFFKKLDDKVRSSEDFLRDIKWKQIPDFFK